MSCHSWQGNNAPRRHYSSKGGCVKLICNQFHKQALLGMA